MRMWSLPLLFILVQLMTSCRAQDEGEEDGDMGDTQAMNIEPTYRSESGYFKRPSYGRPSYGGGYDGGYHRRGYGYRGYNSGPYNRDYKDDDDDVTKLDELYARLEVVQARLKTQSEGLGALEARQAVEKKRVDQFTIHDYPAAQKADENQDNELARLMDQLNELNNALNTLETLVGAIETGNADVLNNQLVAQTDLANANEEDTQQDGDIANALATVKDLKEKLLTVMNNRFETVDNRIDNTNQFLDIVKNKEKARMCEVGQVTLDADDRKAEYLFTTDFAYIPQVLFSICGYSFDLDARRDYYIGRGGYGGGYGGYKKPPNTLGVSAVGSMITQTGVTFEGVDLSFGDTALETMDICFSACTIGPNDDISPLDNTFFNY